VKVPEIFQVETPHGPGGLASVLNAMAEAGLVLEHVSTVRRDQAPEKAFDYTYLGRALADAAPTGQLLPDPLDVTVHVRVSRAVQAAGAAQGSLAAELRDAPRLPDVPDPESETT
jgi:hypothetical protein